MKSAADVMKDSEECNERIPETKESGTKDRKSDFEKADFSRWDGGWNQPVESCRCGGKRRRSRYDIGGPDWISGT